MIFSCDDGFNLRGSTERVCGVDGKWSEVETICEGKTLLKEEKTFIAWYFKGLSWSRVFCFVVS